MLPSRRVGGGADASIGNGLMYGLGQNMSRTPSVVNQNESGMFSVHHLQTHKLLLAGIEMNGIALLLADSGSFTASPRSRPSAIGTSEKLRQRMKGGENTQPAPVKMQRKAA